MRSTMMLVWFYLAVNTAGCSDTSGPVDDGVGDAAFSATIDGVAWRADPSATRASRDQGQQSLVVTGLDQRGNGIFIGVPATTTGTYTVGTNTPTLGIYVENSGQANSKNWRAFWDQGSGSVTLTTLTANRVAGTFQFDVVAAEAGTTPTVRRITNGRFDVPITQ